MPLTYTALPTGASGTPGTYEYLRYQLLLSIEESGNPANDVYADHVGIPTMGVGFNLRVAGNLLEVVREVLGNATWNPAASPANQNFLNQLRTIFARNWTGNVQANTNDVNAALRAYTGNQNAVFTLTDDQVRTVFDRVVPTYEAQVDGRVAGVPNSYERLALLSFCWNNPALLGPNMQAGINGGDRVATWYDIRYRNNGGASQGGGIAKRRYLESQLFGLYEGGATATTIGDAGAIEVYRMYTQNRTTILAYEQSWNTYIARADADYATFLGQVTDARRRDVETLEESLTIAGDALKTKFLDAAQNPENTVVDATQINYLDIQVADTAGGTLNGSSRSGYDISAGNDSFSDLLVGQAGADTLKGLGGNDALIGQGGDDTLEGGAGNDYLVGGENNDILEGGDGQDVMLGGTGSDTYRVGNSDILKDDGGQGEVYWGNTQLVGGKRKEEDPPDTYYSEDGSYTYVLNGDTLTVTNAAGESVTVKTFANRDLGIVLEEEEDDEDEDGPDVDDAENRTSPIIVDLDGDGVETTAYSRNRYFDHDANGMRESTAWAGGDDGLLVRDLDGDGSIESGREMFGSNTLLRDGTRAQHGFAALQDLDENQDGLIDARDAVFTQLQIWRDANGNARTDAGELLSLEQAGVSALRTGWTASTTVDANGQHHAQIGGAVRADGGDIALSDVWFTVDTGRRVNAFDVELPSELLRLPNAKAFGNLPDLRQAMALDPVLRGLVETYIATEDPIERAAQLEGLIFQWTGVANVDPNSRDPRIVYGHVMDARQLMVLESLIGRGYAGTWCWGERDPNPHGNAAPLLIAEFKEFERYVRAQLTAQIERDTYSFIEGGFASGYAKALVDWSSFLQQAAQLRAAGEVAKLGEIIGVLKDLGVYSSSFRTERDQAFATLQGLYPDLAPLFDTPSVIGTVGNDTLFGGSAGEIVVGGRGDDLLYGSYGNDNYFYRAGDGNDRIFDHDGVDQLVFLEGVAPGALTLGRDLTSVFITITVDGSTSRLRLDNFFDENGFLHQGVIESIRFHDGTVWDVNAILSRIVLPVTEGADTIYGTTLNDVVDARGGDDVIHGLEGHDTLSGGGGNDVLIGGNGNDVLAGGAGADTLNGGAGSDTYRIGLGAGHDTIEGFDDSAGRVDRVLFDAGILPGNVQVRRQGDDLLLVLSPTDSVVVRRHFQNDGAGNYSIHGVEFADGTLWNAAALNALALGGTSNNDTLTGFASDDVVHGLAGNDSIRGAAGNDTLHGEDGNDTLYGDQGDDLLLGGEGVDQLYGGEGNDDLRGDAASDTLYGGYGDDQIRGGDGNDAIFGEAGHDQLRGGRGDDRLEGGYGDDNYFFSRGDGKDRINDVQGHSVIYISDLTVAEAYFRREGTDLAIRFASSPDDEIRLEQFFDAQSGLAQRGLRIDPGGGLVWDITPEGIDAEVIKATAAADRIHGNSLDNFIGGLAGDDTIYAAGGNDTLEGGDGADSLHGEAGNDLLGGGAGDDVLHGGEGDDQLAGEADNDILHAGVGNDALSGGIGNDQLYGDVGDDALSGGAGDDLLDGGAGADQLLGGAGDDTYVVDAVADVVTEAADAGVDLVQSSVSYTLPENVERLLLTGGDAIDATGNAASNEIIGNSGNNRLAGLEGDDALDGSSGDDILIGGAGQDLLDGGQGVDQLSGGTGDDTYVVDDAADAIVELAGEGNDTVRAYGDYTLSENIETLVLEEGGWASSGTGNVGSQTLIGNSSGNRLDGAAGADTMSGGAGNDTYVVDDVGDVVVEAAGEGSDTVESSIDYVLGDTLEHLVLTGSADLRGTGNAANNTLVGNDGDNRLRGGAGSDQLYGGLGDDYFIIEASGDRVFEQADEGLDTIERRFETNLVLAANVENLLLATGVQTGNGNGLDNLITGNTGNNRLAGLGGDDELLGLAGDDSMWGDVGSDRLVGAQGNDYLDGGAGVDELDGGSGNDIYIVDNGGDTVIEAAGQGTDQVQASASYVLAANVENFFLTGSGAIDGTGNALDNYIAGNDADNAIDGAGGGDTIVGGAGNDALTGGTGDDKYVFDAASGSDLVDNAGGGNDGIFFTNGVARDRLSFTRDGDDLLIWIDEGETPAVRVTNHFLGGDAAIDYVQPDGGFLLTTTQINQIVAGGQTGGQYDQVIDGTAAGEQLVGSAGADLVRGLGGDDQLFGMGGADTLEGGDGADYLGGGNGSGTGSGADRLEGGAGNDTLAGEDGANVLIGGAGNDSYLHGTGQDTIDNVGGGFDGVFFGSAIAVGNLAFTRAGDDLLITVNGSASDTVRVTGHFLGGDQALDFVQPGSGNMLNTAAINALVGGGGGGGAGGGQGNDSDYPNVVTGTAAGEQLLGAAGRDLIRGLGGNDTLFGFGGDDKFEGGDGDDYISGGNGSFSGSGNDILIGGAGADTLVGEDGSDTLFGGAGDDDYYYSAGSGSDTIDNVGGGTDWLFFNSIAANRLTFHRDGDDLVVRVDTSAAQQVRVLKHFLGGEQAIAFVQPGSGPAISAAQIAGRLTPLPAAQSTQVARQTARDMSVSPQAELETLIAAMAGFAPPASGSSALTPANDVRHHQWAVAASV